MAERTELTDKEAAFVQEYLVDMNARAAAIRAGYSEHSATDIGSELFERPRVVAAIENAMIARANRTQITQDRVLRELARIAFSDMRDLYSEDGRLLGPREMSEDAAAAVAGIDVETAVDRRRAADETKVVTKIRRWDKLKALEMLGKHVGLGIMDPAVTVNIGSDGARERIAGRISRLASDEAQNGNPPGSE